MTLNFPPSRSACSVLCLQMCATTSSSRLILGYDPCSHLRSLQASQKPAEKAKEHPCGELWERKLNCWLLVLLPAPSSSSLCLLATRTGPIDYPFNLWWGEHQDLLQAKLGGRAPKGSGVLQMQGLTLGSHSSWFPEGSLGQGLEPDSSLK